MRKLTLDTTHALANTIATANFGADWLTDAARINRCSEWATESRGRMPDFLRFPIAMLTLLFSAHALLKNGAWFHHLDQESRNAHLLAWKSSRLGFCRDLVRFYESLVALRWFAA